MSYNSKYTGEQVEGLLDQIANGEIGGGIEEETDPIFSASPAATITENDKAAWSGKQDAIDDLATIRDGASKGATAVQPSALGDYALASALDDKVDKVNGKQLSTEDFTSALKGKLEGLSNYDDTELSEALSTLRGDFDKLVSGDTTTAIKTFNEIIAFLDGIQDSQDLPSIIASIEQQIAAKQDKITDLDTIRDGASKGATALQSIPEEYVTEEELLWVKAEGEAGVRLKGTNGTATGNLAISAGDDKTASDGTQFTSAASGDHAVAFGYGNTCAGRSTLAQGLYNTVNGKDSVAFGQRNLVGGDQAFAAGQQNEVTTRLGVAIGYKNKATNTDSIAIGYQNTSGGSASVAMGDTCEANGTSSTAMGYKTKATGAYSSTFGQSTQATNNGEVAMGMYNKSTTSTDTSEQTMFSFGIGTSDTDRVNALEIKKNGDVYVGDKLLSDALTLADTAVQPQDIKDEVYIADFTMESLRDGIYNGTNVECDVQALVSAMNANKVILVREGEDSLYKGVYVLNGFAEDLLYFSIVDTSGNILWCEGTDYMSSQYIDGQSLHERSWGDKQDTLKSGENIKTINGESILGEGNIIIAGGDTGSGGGNAPEVVEVEATTKLGSTRVTFADILPNKIYICNEPIDLSVTITFAPSTSPIDNYTVIFRSSAAGTSLNVPDNVIFKSEVLIGAGMYEFSFRRINWGDEEVIYGLRANFE